MITLRKSEDRGHADHGWLDSYHSFSFADYYDADHMGFRSLRVINDDKIAGGGGFGTHPHRDMEIITYILEGELEHQDSLGNGAVMKPGEVQVMTAGTGVKHSEFNHSQTEMTHLLQIWILPEQKALPPHYDQKSFAESLTPGKFVTVASRDGRDGSLRINQDVNLLIAKFNEGDRATHELKPNRHAWVQVAVGKVMLNGQELKAGDGAAVSDDKTLTFTGKPTVPSAFVRFELEFIPIKRVGSELNNLTRLNAACPINGQSRQTQDKLHKVFFHGGVRNPIKSGRLTRCPGFAESRMYGTWRACNRVAAGKPAIHEQLLVIILLTADCLVQAALAVMKNRKSKKMGFTLIEIMIVVAIIGLLAAIAIPSFVHARNNSQTNACIYNLREIDSAKQNWALDNKVSPTTVPGSDNIQGYMGRGSNGSLPTCPADPTSAFGSSYSINNLQLPPTCLISTNHVYN